jgi:excisionase family DNA binding protein
MLDNRETVPYLTIPEAATLLRVSRTTAYEMARRYLLTGGREGLPVVRVNKRLLRIPRQDFETWFRCQSPIVEQGEQVGPDGTPPTASATTSLLGPGSSGG